ncbi:transcriptional regulator, TetR family [Frankia torreyi]|uniref:Transcriptional regulator, TetR family n=1 Tax=Frankia torreyi TaxID=1856 RepID=A0A0D8BGQ5_9ACTN|nr:MULTISPECIES: TetR/AcrR family transcriptional regulator [Frankia]KJE23453.1 transcriptional regulator, TetR family [Frankia torreyi]
MVHTVNTEPSRTYRQRRRAETTDANTERILRAATELFVDRSFEHITLPAVAERAGVGLQTVIRRVGTKDGLVRAVNGWIVPQIAATRGDPGDIRPAGDDLAGVTDRLARHYEQWGRITERALHQQDASPALKESADAGRRAHREWIEAVFAADLDPLPPAARDDLAGRLAAVCGVELWLVLRRDQDLSVAAARAAVADLVSACRHHARLPAHSPAHRPAHPEG